MQPWCSSPILLEYCGRMLAWSRDRTLVLRGRWLWSWAEQLYGREVSSNCICLFRALRRLLCLADLLDDDGLTKVVAAQSFLRSTSDAQLDLLSTAAVRELAEVLSSFECFPSADAAPIARILSRSLGELAEHEYTVSDVVLCVQTEMNPSWAHLPNRTLGARRQAAGLAVQLMCAHLLPSLGLVTYGPGEFLALTATGCQHLSAQPPLSIDGLEPLTVGRLEQQPILDVTMRTASCHVEVTHPGPAALVYDLELIGQGDPNGSLTYSITSETLERATRLGYTAEAIRNLLVSWAHYLPLNVELWLDDYARERHAVGLERGYRLTFAGQDVLTRVSHWRSMSGCLRRGASGCEAWVNERDLSLVLKKLSAEGFELETTESLGETTGFGTPGEFTALPRLPLYVALQCYRLLQRLRPRLAPFDLAPLCQRLRHGLAPAERLAADKLARSHASLIVSLTKNTGAGKESGEGGDIQEDLPISDLALGQPHALVYIDGLGRLTTRLITPARIERHTEVTLLLATHPGDAQEYCFRTDRIIGLLPLEKGQTIPPKSQ